MNSPSRNQTRNLKKLGERKTYPTSPEGYIMPKYPEKGKGELHTVWLSLGKPKITECNKGWSGKMGGKSILLPVTRPAPIAD